MNAPGQPQYPADVHRHAAADGIAVKFTTAQGYDVDRGVRFPKVSCQLADKWRNTSPRSPNRFAMALVVIVSIDHVDSVSGGLEAEGKRVDETGQFGLAADDHHVTSFFLRRFVGNAALPPRRQDEPSRTRAVREVRNVDPAEPRSI